MKSIVQVLVAGCLLAAPSFAGIVIDYVTPFTSSNGLSINNASQAGQTVTVPVGATDLTSFSLVFYNSTGVPLSGQVQTWNTGTSSWNSPVYISTPSATGTTQVLGSYYAYTYSTNVAVTAGELLFLSFGGTGFSGNLAWFGYPSNVYAGGNLLVNQGSGLAQIFNVGEDMAFSAAFNMPEPGTLAMMLGGAGLIGLFQRRRKR